MNTPLKRKRFVYFLLLTAALVVYGCVRFGVKTVAEHRRINFLAAIKQGQTEEALSAIQEGVDVNCHEEATDGQSLFRLISESLSGHSKQAPGESALQIAAEHNNHRLTAALIRKGAHDVSSDPTDTTPILTLALKRQWTDVVSLLMQRGEADKAPYALLQACYTGDLPTVQLLLNKTVCPDAHFDAITEERNGESPLTIAAGGGQTAIVKLLVAQGAAINNPDVHGYTALMAAAGAGDVESVRLLLAHGADVNDVDHFGTALYYAATRGQLAVIKLLIAAGADVNRRGAEADRDSPLSAARRANQGAVAQYLKLQGAK